MLGKAELSFASEKRCNPKDTDLYGLIKETKKGYGEITNES